MLMFIIYALLIFIVSNGVGKLFIKKDSSLYKLVSPIGFIILMGLLQIVYYPFEYFHLSGNISFIITGIISIILLILGIKNLKKEDFSFLKDYRFYLLLLLLFGIMKIIPSVDATDDEFYFPLIMDNAYNLVNTIDPLRGIKSIVDPYHAYQGFYLFVSFIYRVQHSIFNSTLDIYVVSK